MARLITTKAEKAAASFLDWDDASLGKFCKQMALKLRAARDKQREDGKRNDNFRDVVNAADGMLLVGSAIECNAGTLTLTLGDFTHCDAPSGDWEIRVRQVKKPKN